MKKIIPLALVFPLLFSACQITPVFERCAISGDEEKRLLTSWIGTWENRKDGFEKIVITVSAPEQGEHAYDLLVICEKAVYHNNQHMGLEKPRRGFLPLGISPFFGESKKYVNIAIAVDRIGNTNAPGSRYALKNLKMLYPLNYLAEIRLDSPDQITVYSVEFTRGYGREPVDEAIRMETTDGFTVIVNSPDEIMGLLNAGKYISNYRETFYRAPDGSPGMAGK